MQLITLTLVVLIASGGQALAQEAAPDAWSGEVVSRYLLYADDDATTVSTAALDASISLPQEIGLGAHFLLDAVSSASVDVVTAATERWTENRVEAGLRANRTVGSVDLGLGYTRSQEQDWSSNSFRVGAGRDFFQRNFRVEATVGTVLNRIGRASDPVFEEDMQVYSGDVGLSQLVDERTRVGLIFGTQLESGYQASPYRYVSAADGSRMPESHPDERLRSWLSTYALRELTDAIAARLQYRFYWDDWGVRSHTAELSIRADVSETVYVALNARGYQQGDADFYRKGYPEAQLYMSNDRELSRFWNVGSGLTLGAQLGPVLVDAKAAITHYSFKNFEALPTRLATTVGAGASLPW